MSVWTITAITAAPRCRGPAGVQDQLGPRTEAVATRTEATDETIAPAREPITAALRSRVQAGADLEQISVGEIAGAVGVQRSTVYKHRDAADAVGVSRNGQR
jgi:hypothetical protein